MAEEQALDRVHRIGQTRPVIAIRYILSDSVEEVRAPSIPLVNTRELICCYTQYVVSLQKKKLDFIHQSFASNTPLKANALKERLKVS